LRQAADFKPRNGDFIRHLVAKATFSRVSDT